MVVKKTNPNRWYIVMVFVICLSFFVFVAGPRFGYPNVIAHDIAIMIGLWAPTLGLLGVRAELMQKKQG